MEAGEVLTRGTVWVALTLYVLSECLRSRRGLAWRLNAAGCAFFVAHVACAFHFFHDWSHADAYAETARQTRDLTGWNSGAGLFVNYAFAVVWVAWAATERGKANRTGAIKWAVRAFFLFMIFNGAFVFVRTPLRWFGLLLCLALLVAWGRERANSKPPSAA